MIGKLRFNVLSNPIELDLKRVTILLGDDNMYSFTSFGHIKSLLTKGELTVYDLKYITCDTDLIKIEDGKIIKNNRDVDKTYFLYPSLYGNQMLSTILKDRSEYKDIFLLEFIDSRLSPKDSIFLLSYLIELYKEGKRFIIRTCNIFTMYYLNVLFIKGEIKEEDLAVYNIDRNAKVNNLIKDSPLDRIKEIDLSYFDNSMRYINEELFKSLQQLNK